jgi:hypothetical protein
MFNDDMRDLKNEWLEEIEWKYGNGYCSTHLPNQMR